MTSSKLLFLSSFVVLGSFVSSSSHIVANAPNHTHDELDDSTHSHYEDEHGTPGGEYDLSGDEHGAPGGDADGGIPGKSFQARKRIWNDDVMFSDERKLIWPVQTDSPGDILYLSFNSPSWDGQVNHT